MGPGGAPKLLVFYNGVFSSFSGDDSYMDRGGAREAHKYKIGISVPTFDFHLRN